MVRYNVVFFNGEQEFSEIIEAKNESHLINLLDFYYPAFDVVSYEEVKEEENVL